MLIDNILVDSLKLILYTHRVLYLILFQFNLIFVSVYSYPSNIAANHRFFVLKIEAPC